MQRVRLTLPRGRMAEFRYRDLVHDAIVQALASAGAESETLVGRRAEPWVFAALGRHERRRGLAHSVVIATPSRNLAPALLRIDPRNMRFARAKTSEFLDFSEATVTHEGDPIASGQDRLGVVMLSPLALKDRGGRRWRTDLTEPDISEAVSASLSRRAGREVRLEFIPDSLYLRTRKRHSVLVATRGDARGNNAFVIAMEAPALLTGSEEDLRFAWYAGLGAKTRNGFGCLGLVDEGIGR